MKKKLFILTFLITSISNSQSWNYKTVTNDFDGKYKMARVYGTGGEFPYKKPDLVVFKRSNGTMAIYISGIGYSGCDNRFVYFKFNGDEKKYKTNYVASGANDDAWFISSMKDISKGTLLTKFTKYNYVSVRIGSNCGLNDYRFSLEGSTKAINYVFGENYIINLQKEKAILRDLEKKKKKSEKKKKERERVHKKHINNKIKNFNITTDDKERLLKRIIKKYSESDVNLLEVDSINIKGKDVFFDIELFDLLKEKIGIIKSVILPSVVILKFSDLQQSQIELPLGSLEKQKSEAESLLKEKKYLKLSKKAFYFNKTDIKAYANIYNIKYEFIVPRETLIAIDEDYFEANYFKIKYVIKSYLFVKIYVKKENLVKLIL